MEITKFGQEAAQLCGLGAVTAPLERVSGGFLHKMYKLETASGKYALKLLNPVIMKRENVLENFQRAERLERILEENQIPIIPALERNGRKMQCLNGQHFYLFAWSKGNALSWHEISKEHCEIAGALLARIHNVMPVPSDVFWQGMHFDVDWDGYVEEAGRICPEIACVLTENRELLYLAQTEYNMAVDSVPKACCICDGDMDCKNVLWDNGRPFVIDLECLDYGNPYLEMFQLALSWAGGAVCDMDFVRLGVFLKAYRTGGGVFPVDWRDISGVGYSWLDWLAYNVRRGLAIECNDEEERRLGIREVQETVRRIRYYHSVRKEMLEYIGANLSSGIR